MIRYARVEDCETIARLGEIFHAEAAWSDICAFKVADCRKSLEVMCDLPDAILLVAEQGGEIVGMAGGLISPLYFDLTHRTGQELFWWVSPGASKGTGLKLLEAMEQAARDKGCSSWAMMALETINSDKMARLYRMHGYRPSERTFIKRL